VGCYSFYYGVATVLPCLASTLRLASTLGTLYYLISLLHMENQILKEFINPKRCYPTGRILTQFEIQAALIPDQNKLEYQSAGELITAIREAVSSCSAEEYFLYFPCVVDHELEVLDNQFETARVGLPSAWHLRMP